VAPDSPTAGNCLNAASSVEPVVTTSSTTTAPSGGRPRLENDGRVRSAWARPAWRIDASGASSRRTTSRPVMAPRARAISTPGSIPSLRRRPKTLGIGTRQVASGGSSGAIAVARILAAWRIPRYLSAWTRSLAGPSCRNAGRTMYPSTTRGEAGRSRDWHSWHTRQPRSCRHERHITARSYDGPVTGTDQVPCRQPDRYETWSAVSSSSPPPRDASLSDATCRSISSGSR